MARYVGDGCAWAGVHGKQEVEVFCRLPPFPRETAVHPCHLTLMQILPGLYKAQLAPAGEGFAELQHLIGDPFSGANGGALPVPL